MIKFFKFFNNRIFDNKKYIIPKQVITDSQKVLREYASLEPSNEGLVYWGGTKNEQIVTVTTVIAPKTDSSYGRVSTSYKSNSKFVQALNEKKIVYIAQVHSHPTTWVDHSEGDDAWAPFKIDGLLSIVVPTYGKNGILPLTKCGVHRFEKTHFERLPRKYVKKHFVIDSQYESDFVEMRK